MSSGFVHLHVHSEYSLVDGIVRIKPLMSRVEQQKMPAIALTDQCNLFALVKFYRAAFRSGIKPIIGAEMLIKENEQEAPSRLVLLCQNQKGYNNLSKLISKAYQEGQFSGLPLLDKRWFHDHTDGLIALSGGRVGNIGRALLSNKVSDAENHLQFWMTVFPERFYLELQRTGRENEEPYIAAALSLASQYALPVVATNDVRFLEQSDYEAHETRVCIHEGRTLEDPRRSRAYSDQQYLKSPQQMQALFSDIPEALQNTIEIAKRCSLVLNMGESFLPQFPVPDNETIASFFTLESDAGLAKRLNELQLLHNEVWPDEKIAKYKQRLKIEIDVITNMGFPGYFLIVADFIRWAKENDIPVGPGRGSGAGSLVAYVLGITDLDPIAYDLLFERFLNPERVSLPDFDVDFCMEGRDRVIDYVAERYGRHKVSQIITYGTMAAKAVVRDVGRVLGFPYGFVDRIAKLIPFEIGMTLSKALEDSEELLKAYQEEEEVTALLDLARSLEGIARNAGKHAGGVVIAPSELTDFTPLYCEQDGQGLVTQLDKDDIEAIGLVKFDFLGLRTLTIIDWAVKAINKQAGGEQQCLVDISKISLKDEKVFQLLKRQATTAVFQLESRGMKDLIKRLQPDIFDEIVALVALFRPGPLQSGMVDDFIARKHGKMVEYPHPALEPILQPTYGVILYQEQVMQIAQVLAGYSLGDADLLRRAMGKKKPEEMAKQREIFTVGAVANGVAENTATNIFDSMEKFAGYGFNKSHSVAYALLSYQTAWLKAHYPAEFMSAVLSADMDNTDKVEILINECRDMEITVIPPDINHSAYKFTVHEGAIAYGLGAIKGLGLAAIEGIEQERKRNGSFDGLYDFCRRVDTQKLNKRAQEALIRSGALGSLGYNRATLMASLADAVKVAEQHQRDHATGQASIFGDAFEDEALPSIDITPIPEWDETTLLVGEKETLGLYLTGHPINQYAQELQSITGKRIIDQIELAESKKMPSEPKRYGSNDIDTVLAGVVMSVRVHKGRSGKRAILTLDDQTARVDVVLWADDFAKYQDIIIRDQVLIVDGAFGYDDFSGGYRIRAKEVYDLDLARQRYAKHLELGVNDQSGGNGFVNSLMDVLSGNGKGSGECPVWINYKNNHASAPLRLGDEWKVRPNGQLMSRLKTLLGDENVKLVY